MSATTAPSSQLVSDLVRHLRAARMEARIYEENHPRRATRIEELRIGLVEAAGRGRVVLAIEGDNLLVNDQAISDANASELVDIFRERMIRRVAVGREVQKEEIQVLLSLLTENAELPGGRTAHESSQLGIEYFDALLDLDRAGNKVGGVDESVWKDFAPEQVAAIRMVTSDDRVRSKLGSLTESKDEAGSVDFIQRFFRLLATDAGTNWHNPDGLTGTLLAGLDLVHEAQTAKSETGEIPRHLMTESEGFGKQLQARFRWKLLGAMFGADESSARTAEDVLLPTEGPTIDVTDLHEIQAGPFPAVLEEIIAGQFSPATELEFYVRTLVNLSEIESSEGWNDSFRSILESRSEVSEALQPFVSWIAQVPELLRFFQDVLVDASILRRMTTDLAVESCVKGREQELAELLAKDTSEVLEPEFAETTPALLALLSVMKDSDLRALDLAYALILRADPIDRWQGPWGQWLIERILATRAVAAWLRTRAASLFAPEQFPLFFALSEDVIADLKETMTELDQSTALRFLTALKDDADLCPLGFLVSATRHASASVRCLAVQCLGNRTDSASVGILFHRLQTCEEGEATEEELGYIFEGLERRSDVDIRPRLKEIVRSRVGFRYVWPRELRDRAKVALKRIKKARKSDA